MELKNVTSIQIICTSIQILQDNVMSGWEECMRTSSKILAQVLETLGVMNVTGELT